LKEYVFKSLEKSIQFQVLNEKLEIWSSSLRTGEFDNQGSSHSWTWAWTTDGGSFEIWTPKGIYLSLDSAGGINLFSRSLFSGRTYNLKTPKELCIGKTGWISYGIVAINFDGSKVSLVKDTYPFWDACMNVTYDGICEDEDFYPLRMMGRELSKRLSIPFDESIRP
jgi:hypothetical protein